MKYISTVGMSREDWLRARKNGIGGSDAWRIVLTPEQSPYAGCLELFREKTSDAVEESESLPCRIGTYLEPLVADLYAEETGRAVHRYNRIIISEEHPFMFANIDRKLRGVNEGLECKTIGEFAARLRFTDEETGEVRWMDRFVEGDMEASLQNKLEWYIQMQHYMAVTGWEMWHLAVLIGNRKFLWYDVPRDQAWIDMITEKETEFWECVQNNNNIWEE